MRDHRDPKLWMRSKCHVNVHRPQFCLAVFASFSLAISFSFSNLHVCNLTLRAMRNRRALFMCAKVWQAKKNPDCSSGQSKQWMRKEWGKKIHFCNSVLSSWMAFECMLWRFFTTVQVVLQLYSLKTNLPFFRKKSNFTLPFFPTEKEATFVHAEWT